MEIPKEDGFEDILGKAQRGLGIEDQRLSNESGVSIDLIHALREGELHESALRDLCPALALDPESLLRIARHEWHPSRVGMEGFEVFHTVFHGMTVASYLVWDPATRKAAVFDTGADSAGPCETIDRLGLDLEHLFLTHTHADHLADLEPILELGAVLRVNRREPLARAEVFDEGETFAIGNLLIETRLTSGHSLGGTTFLIQGLERPLAVVGDALFAGSVGGGIVSYPDALDQNRTQILSLANDTVLAPGHGPVTTVGEEKEHNPFFPEFK